MKLYWFYKSRIQMRLKQNCLESTVLIVKWAGHPKSVLPMGQTTINQQQSQSRTSGAFYHRCKIPRPLVIPTDNSSKYVQPKFIEQPTNEKSDIFTQFLASSAKNLLIWNLGSILVFPAIVIPPLTGIDKGTNEPLSISASQASWLGK